MSGAQAADAGDYAVVVANGFGTATSEVATLTVVASPVVGTPDGYATVGPGATGGAGGPSFP